MSGRDVGISIDESAQFGIVITGLEVIEGGFSILRLTSMPILGCPSPTESRESLCAITIHGFSPVYPWNLWGAQENAAIRDIGKPAG